MKDRKENSCNGLSSNLLTSLAMSFTFSVFLFMIPVFAYPSSTQINFILDLADGKGIVIPDATCTGYIWNNDLTTINQTLSLTYSSQSQVYHSPFTTSDTAGEYLQTAVCNLTNGKTVYDKKTFSVESFANIDEKLISINNTVKNQTDYWGSLNYNNTNTWGTTIDSDVNYWGNNIWYFLQNITFGGNVTANVDYDRIAVYTLSYFKGAKFWCWFVNCPEAGKPKWLP